jgi:type IV pilus assembly protein PilO
MADMNLDLSKLDANNIGDWPLAIKGIAILVVCVAALGVGYWQHTQKQIIELEKEQRQEAELKRQFKIKQEQANILPQLKAQLEQIEESFGELLKRLPNKTEVEALLVDIAQQALASGLTVELFQPGGEAQGKGGFYVELPITLQLSGDYHAMGKFVSMVAALPRIVTQHNIKLTPKGDGTLTMNQTAKTYRYVEQKE